jgi:N-acetylglucosaminyldiphosphoundecaprenol N-acetyl-beta-D-mannosaminyltransferase
MAISAESTAWSRSSVAHGQVDPGVSQGLYPKAVSEPVRDDLAREVYCIQGLPIDAVDMATVVSRIETAADRHVPFVISTPNLNFVVQARSNSEFRGSVLRSDLCPPDGMPIVWIARLLGLPIKHRVAGSDMFEALKARRPPARPLSVFFFGGAEGVAAAASKSINAQPSGVSCVGSMFPGYGSVEEFSRQSVIDRINASHADFLMASLGALKGQIWLSRNHDRFQVPVRAHLGAVVNFQAAKVKRAPAWIADLGLEWLWRVREEPHLWRRYLSDGLVLLRLLITRVWPLAIAAQLRRRREAQDLRLLLTRHHDAVTINLSGDATVANVEKAVACFRGALETARSLEIDVSRVRAIDARFIGLLLMLAKQARAQDIKLEFAPAPPRIRRAFRWHGASFLLSGEAI